MSDLLDDNIFENIGEDGEDAVPLGERLLEKGVLSDDQLRIALFEQQNSQDPLGRVLVRLGFLTEATLRDIFSETGGTGVVDLTRISADPEVLARVPIDVAKRYNVFPVAFHEDRNAIVLAVANPNDLVLADQIRAFLGGGYELEFMVAEESEISRAVDEYYGLELTIEGILREIESGEISTSVSSAGSGGESSSNPIVRLVNAFLNDAVKRGASDIHFEPEESFLRVRYRIDGVLRQIRSLHRSYWSGMAVRLKVMSEMNIAESRLPQDGRISFTLYGRIVDFRVASQPVTHGENFVLRILDQQRNISKINNLGLSDRSMHLLQLILARPSGVIMVTGPTGSGKTTTLYSIIQHMNKESVNIMTLEDPVEYPLPMIRQSNAGESSKMDWAGGIKSMLRQDPDIILVGEVRSTETAELTFRAAMTGHLVLTTLHTNSAIGVLPRLSDMGVLPDIMATNVSGVVAQRLVRKLCSQCKKKAEEITDMQRAVFSEFIDDIENADLYEAVGCASCEFQGYRGRVAIMEVLKFNDELDECVVRRVSAKEVRKVAIETNVYVSMAEEGMDKIFQGQTTLDEIKRVVDLTDILQKVGISSDGHEPTGH
ncbi:MAG: Flp pilus assembly complex ATPase component TadA [Proteobacteria bacterium]|nr:Flp pilus assembly complex ATPase component TadA [Pseudomonadota bacterium]